MARREPEVCYRIRNRIEKFRNTWAENIKQYHEWMNFIMGVQWTEDESKLFTRYNKIPMQVNKLGVLMNHLLAEQMQNTPNLQIHPGDNVPVEQADIRAALVKNISLNSDAKLVYQTAFQQAVIGGYGAYRVGTEYVSDKSFLQEIKMYEINDPTRCYWDLGAKNKCKTDGMWSGFLERMSRPRFKSLYGESLERRIGSSAVTEDSQYAFQDDDTITVVYDYERVYSKATIYQLSDEKNSIIDSDEFKTLEKIEINGDKMVMYNGEAVAILNKREVPRYKVKHRKIAGDFILDEEDFASEQLPIVYVDQKSYLDRHGKQITRSFFQDAKDPQRFLNYLATQIAYFTKVSRYDQFMGPRKCIQSPDAQEMWKDPSIQQGMLIYDETPSGLKPEQLNPPIISPSLVQQYERTLMDIASGTGMYQTQLGQNGNETSGAAIDARTERGSYNTYVPFNSLNIAITCGGQIINEMIPKIYDTQRTLMLSMPQSENQPVEINKPMDDYSSNIMNDMTSGDYKIRLMAGPSYEGQKAEALNSIKEILQASPDTVRLVLDLFAENLPIPNSMELRNRLRTLVPPEIIEAGKTGKPLPPKPQGPDPQQQMMMLKEKELQIKVQQAEQTAALKQQELQLKQSELQRKALETHHDMNFEWEKIESQKEKAAAELQEQLLRYNSEMHRIDTDAHIQHGQNLVDILTHQPDHLKPAKEAKHERTNKRRE